MDRRFRRFLISGSFAAAVSAIGCGGAWAQEAASRPSASPSATAPVSAPADWQIARDRAAALRIEQLAPEDRESFMRNLTLWRNLPPDEREALRNQARARVQEEIAKAVQEAGLHLDPDQREVFALRYSQERRKLERDIQRKAAADRARQLPEIIARLKAEFGAAASPAEGK